MLLLARGVERELRAAPLNVAMGLRGDGGTRDHGMCLLGQMIA
ncbi:hypothetical protein N183_33005 [Sinorhizobium sp. Sb3]|nr:hypothetical protein N183_33005 [Sinorhizobium sp. Sb3]